MRGRAIAEYETFPSPASHNEKQRHPEKIRSHLL